MTEEGCRTIAGLLRKQVEAYGAKAWLIFYPEGPGTPEDAVAAGERPRASAGAAETITYREFYERTCRTANFLLAQGIGRGDRIATVAQNHPDTVTHYFAAWMIGAVVVPINTGEDDKRIGFILENSRSQLVFVREESLARIRTVLRDVPGVKTIVRVGEGGGSHAGGSRQGPEQEEEPLIDFQTASGAFKADIPDLPDPEPGDEALIVYTSGTTGLPKGVVLSQRNLLVDARAIARWHRMTPDQRMMCVLPIHHVNGTVVTLLTPLWYGGSVVLNQKFHSKTFFPRIVEQHVHVVSVVPTLLQFLLHEDPAVSPEELRHFRHIICGAGPLTCELALRFEDRFGIPIIHGYGLSETTCYSCFLPLDLSPAEHRHWLGDQGFPSIGVPLPANEMAIHDQDGNGLPDGMRGEIVIRGENVMKGYFANPEANARAFARGWFRSGDEGFVMTDRQGRTFFFITGRIKELIIRGGVNISPFEIDEVLMHMPGVAAGLAVGFENDWYGEEIGAYITVREGAKLTGEEVLRHCRAVFPFQKCPKVVVFGTEVPVTSTGKYQRNKLKPLFAGWKGVQFREGRLPS